jgi:intracellular multiplication protein IcmD
MKKQTLIAAAYGVGALGFAALGALIGDHGTLLGVDAQTMATTVRGNFGSIADLLGGGAYLAGAAFGIQAALKFKAHNENPQQVKLSQPLTYAVVAGALLALPTWLTTGSDTMFGVGGGTATSINGNSLGR